MRYIDAKKACKELGHKLTRSGVSGEYRLRASWCLDPEHGYFTYSLEDAIGTAKHCHDTGTPCCSWFPEVEGRSVPK